jgi:hypothetical protein
MDLGGPTRCNLGDPTRAALSDVPATACSGAGGGRGATESATDPVFPTAVLSIKTFSVCNLGC